MEPEVVHSSRPSGASARARMSKIFVHVLRWPDDGPITLPAVAKKIVGSRLLTGGEVEVKPSEQGIILTVPQASRQALDTIIELRLNGSAMDIPVLGHGKSHETAG